MSIHALGALGPAVLLLHGAEDAGSLLSSRQDHQTGGAAVEGLVLIRMCSRYMCSLCIECILFCLYSRSPVEAVERDELVHVIASEARARAPARELPQHAAMQDVRRVGDVRRAR